MALVLTSEEAPKDMGGSPRSLAKAAKLAASQAADTEGPPPVFGDLSLVQIHGIEKKPELNDQLGVVVSFDGGPDRRYTVKVSGSMVRLREDKLKVAPEGWEASEDNDVVPVLSAEEREARAKEQARAKKTAAAKALTDAGRDEKKLIKAIEDAKTLDIDTQEAETILNEVQEARAVEQARLQEEARIRDEANIEFMKSLPEGQLTPAGQLVPTYSYVQVPSVASLPQGMEVWMLAGGPKCARIPGSWRLQIVAEGQVDSYRVEVGESTLVFDVLTGAASRFGWAVTDLQLLCDGKDTECDGKATIGSAALFGKKLTARKSF